MGIRIKTRAKYGAVPTIVDGIRFASKGEARRWQELKLLERAGEISSLDRQYSLCLHAAPRYEVGKYIADFCYLEKDGNLVVEDYKGFDTPLSRWKRKHLECEYGIKVRLTGAASRRRKA